MLLLPPGAASEAIALDAEALTTGIRPADELGNLCDFAVPGRSNLTRAVYYHYSILAPGVETPIPGTEAYPVSRSAPLRMNPRHFLSGLVISMCRASATSGQTAWSKSD